MKNWEEKEGPCPAEEDLRAAEHTANQLQVPLHVVNFSEEYWQRVFTHFLETYAAGYTPNPDVLCNKEIKFRAFLDYAIQRGATHIATGHYARLSHDGKRPSLLKGRDPAKDQSYFLHALNAEQLAASLFPVGDLLKHEVRLLAKKIGLKNYDKKDSTGICFIGERPFKSFLSDYLPKKPGPIETLEGQVIGEHEGLMFHTVGQRKGLHIGGRKDSEEAAWYVAHKDVGRNTLVVVQGNNHPALFKQSLIARGVNWLSPPTTLPCRLSAKIRYRQADQPCSIEAISPDRYRVQFETPQRAVTPGQSIVFYQDDVCLGGGMIEYEHE